MGEFLDSNAYLGLVITISAFAAGRAIQSKWKNPLLNPILIATAIVMAVLLSSGISVEDYQAGCAPLQYLLTPATICYAISLHDQIHTMKRNLFAILAGVACGTLVSLFSIQLMCDVLGLDQVLTVSLLPKSITTAIGMPLSEEAGGIPAVTTAAIILTGILGNMLGPILCSVFRITDPVAKGVSFGTASHAIGTAKAAEISALTGAVSSFSLTFAGLITVILYSFLI